MSDRRSTDPRFRPQRRAQEWLEFEKPKHDFYEPGPCRLFRGNHELPHQSQVTQRDLTGEELVERFAGEESYVSVRSAAAAHAIRQRDGSPYKFIAYQPGHSSMNWTAFVDETALRNFVDAYGLKIAGSIEVPPGEDYGSFRIKVPKRPRFRKLICR